MLIGYQASHEQFAPSELLNCARAAEHGVIELEPHGFAWWRTPYTRR